MARSVSTTGRAIGLLLVLFVLAHALAAQSFAQSELLPLDHPATSTLIRLYEYGAIRDFPREHLPVSRGQARKYFLQAEGDDSVPENLREQARYYRIELDADYDSHARAVFFATGDSSRLIYDDPFGGHPIAMLEARDSSSRSRLVFEPVGVAEVRVDPVESKAALVTYGGAQLRGTVLDHLGFSARVTNGFVVGDSSIGARDPEIACLGTFGVVGYGRDIDFASGHVRVDFDNVSAEIGREDVQLGGGRDRSLLLGSLLPCSFDYLRFSAHVGKVAFSHIHGSILADVPNDLRGHDALIPSRYVATHLVSAGPFGGVRLSLGESVIYSRRPFELGYLNPLNFLRAQENRLHDRDNANMYAAVSVNPLDGLFLEGEFLLDDLRFSRIGEGFWSNKTAWRISGDLRANPIGALDIGLSYTRMEPYIFSHFNDTNAYTHVGVPLAAGGLPPNSYLAESTIGLFPLPNLSIVARFGMGVHGANVMQGDSLIFNAGGDVRQTRRDGLDSDIVTFLDGERQTILKMRLEIEYEPIRNVYLRGVAFREQLGADTTTEIRLGLRVGAR